MSLLVVLHVCQKDEHLAHAALRASIESGGPMIRGRIILAYPYGMDITNILKTASEAFTNVVNYGYTPWTGDGEWPMPANHAWQSVARWVDSQEWARKEHTGWLWWEADACPIRAGWYEALDKAHKAKPRTLFAGHKLPAINGEPYMNGVGIWPMNPIEALSNCAALYAQRIPFDIAAGRSAMSSFKPLNHLMVHEVKRRGGGAGRSFDQARFKDLLTTHKQAVFYHGCTDGSLHALVAGKPLPSIIEAYKQELLHDLPTLATVKQAAGRPTYYHSGDLGDIIYSLPAIRELGGGDLLLGPDNRTNMATREKMTLSRHMLIQPLLEVQPFLHAVDHELMMPKDVTYDLNQMRQLLRSHRLDMTPGMNLARCYLQAFGLELDNDSKPWLTVPSPKEVAPVVIARSPRYRDQTFRWDRVVAEYHGQCIFVGSTEEHADFTKQWGPVPYHPTADLLELAQVIAGARLFVGNQSLPYAIAEGLKKPAILEACPAGSNTLFVRKDVTVGVTEHTLLPCVEEGRRVVRHLTDKLTISGPIDWFTGLGRATCQLIEHIDADVVIEPSSIDRRIPLLRKVEHLLRLQKPHPPVTPRLLITPLLDLPKRIQPNDSILTMWESTRLPIEAVDAINRYAAQVIVPSVWCSTTFSANGVNCPIKVVPLGVDAKIYKPSGIPKSNYTRFGAAGRLAHGGNR